MGYDMDYFVNKEAISEEFICSICLCVLQDPVMIDKCQHLFCKGCISDWHKTSKTCPIDRQVIKLKLKPVPRPLLNILNDIPRRCRFGCGSTTKLGATAEHEAACIKNPDFVNECAGNCGAKLNHADMQVHNCVEYLKQTYQTEITQLKVEVVKSSAKILQLNMKVQERDEELEEMEEEKEALKEQLKNAKKERRASSSTPKAATPRSQPVRKFAVPVERQLPPPPHRLHNANTIPSPNSPLRRPRVRRRMSEM